MEVGQEQHRPTLVWSPHPLMASKGRRVFFAHFHKGETIEEYLERVGVLEQMGNQPFILTIEDRYLPRSMWRVCRPHPGTMINLYAVMHGSDRKNPIATIAMIALLVAAPYIAPALLPAGAPAWAIAATKYGIIIVGGLAINDIFPPPKPDLPNPQDLNTSPTYSIAGGSNQLRRYEPMPKLIGTHKVFPDFGAQPYSEIQGEDQFGFYVFDFGYNPDAVLTDFRLGATPIGDFEGVEIQESGPDGVISLFPANVDTVEGAELNDSTGWVQRTSSPNANRLGVEIVGTLFSISDRGELGAELIKIQIQYRAVGASSWIDLQTQSDVTPVAYTLMNLPLGISQSIYLALREYHKQQVAGMLPGEINITNNTRKPVRRTYTWFVNRGQYEVRVRKVTPDFTTDRRVGEVAWTQLRTYQPDTADYTGRKRVALKVRASGQLSGSLPAFSAIVKAKANVWTGTGWDKQVTSNPAWWYLDVLQGLFVQSYLSLPGATGSYASTPDSAAASITSDIDIRVRASLNNWAPGAFRALIAKWVNVGNQRSWMLGIDQNNRPQLSLSLAGTTQVDAHPGTTTGFVNGSTWWLRATWRASDGRVQFFKSEDAVTWTQIGSNGTIAIASIFDGTAAVEVGSNAVGNNTPAGKVFVAEVRTGIDGPVVVRFNPNDAAGITATSFTSLTGEIWSLNQLATLVHGKRVWGAGMTVPKIDIEGLKAFGAWCTQQGLTVNAVLDQQQSVFDALQSIALAGRGTPSWGTGKLGVIWDAPDLPVTAVFGMHNIVAGSFEIDYSTEELADVIEAEFIDPALDWQRNFVRVNVPGATSQARTRRIQLFGRTSGSLAAEDANLYAAQNAYRNRRYRWTTDWEGMPAARGDVIQLSHDLASLDYSGRFVEGGSSTVLNLPRTVPLYDTGSFVVIVKPNGAYKTFGVLGGVGESNTLTLATALSGGDASYNPYGDPNHPPYDFRWLYGPTSTPGKKLKIDSFRPIDERHVELSAIDELPYFYTAKANPFTYVPPRTIFGAAPTIEEVTISYDGVRSGKGYAVKVRIEWQVKGSYNFADVRVAVGDGPMLVHESGLRARSTEIVITDRQDIEVEVTAYSDLGRLGASHRVTKTEHIDFTGQKEPSDVPGFFISGKLFTWNEAPEVDVVGYKIRFHLGHKFSWEDAAPLHQGVITSHDWEAPALPPDNVKVVYLIKAIDAAEQESLGASIIVKVAGDPDIANVLEIFDYRNDVWPGTITNGTISSGDVVANTTTAFYGPNDSAPIYTSDTDPMYPATTYAEVTFETGIVVPAAPLAGSVITIQHVLVGNPVFFEWRQDGAAPMYTLDGDPFYTVNSDPLYDESGPYVPWTGARIIEHGDRYQFRARASQGATQGKFQELFITIDAPDIEEELNNVNISPSGTRLPITKNFTSIKSVQATLEDDGSTAIAFEIVDRNPSLGPLIRALNTSKAAVSGRGDFRVKGW